jgi:retinol-binding protein 3
MLPITTGAIPGPNPALPFLPFPPFNPTFGHAFPSVHLRGGWGVLRGAMVWVLVGLVLSLSPRPGSSQLVPDATVSQAERITVVEAAANLLEKRYVFPELGARLADSLRLDLTRGDFSSFERPEELAAAVSQRIRILSEDGHLWLAVQPEVEGGPSADPSQGPGPDAAQALRLQRARENFGFPSVEILAGDVGYLELRQFMDPALSGETTTAAFSFLRNAEALVVDLRGSMGGSQAMVAFLASHLLEDGERIHLFDSYHRPSERTDQYWSESYLPAPRFLERPVYILTAGRTFSAGEGLAYLLKHLGRATVVGETTGGGTHPGGFHRLNPRFIMFVAEARVTSPVTGDNWEGRGVEPNVTVSSEQALAKAHLLALEHLLDWKAEDPRRGELERLVQDLKTDLRQDLHQNLR